MNKINLPGVKINEKQKCIEKTITFKQLYKDGNLFNRLPFQTDLDEQKVKDMCGTYLKNPDYLVYKNKIVVAVVSTDFSDDYKLYVVDGQHRIEMAKELFEYEDINDYLTICYYKIDTDNKMKELFREINQDSYKNSKYVSLDEFQETLYDLTKEYLKSKYSIYFPDKKSSINRRHSLTEFLNLLVEFNYFNQWENLDEIIKDIESKNKSFNKLIDYQEYWTQSPDLFYKDEQTCVKNGFIISLKNNNFISYLIDSSGVIPDHKFKNQKKTIGPKLRIQIWKKEFDNEYESVCPFYRCTNIIHNGLNGFHCGHVISEFNGGEISFENLRPICFSCNSHMGTTNWDEYEKKCKREYKRNKKKTNNNKQIIINK
jgi:hypothetical protein